MWPFTPAKHFWVERGIVQVTLGCPGTEASQTRLRSGVGLRAARLRLRRMYVICCPEHTARTVNTYDNK